MGIARSLPVATQSKHRALDLEDLPFGRQFLKDYTEHLREFPPYSLLASS